MLITALFDIAAAVNPGSQHLEVSRSAIQTSTAMLAWKDSLTEQGALPFGCTGLLEGTIPQLSVDTD
jgi:hypothetical protein